MQIFSAGRTNGRTNQPKVVQEVLADLKMLWWEPAIGAAPTLAKRPCLDRSKLMRSSLLKRLWFPFPMSDFQGWFSWFVVSNNMAREYSLAANQVPVGHNRVRGLTPEKFVALMIKRKSWNLEILARASYHLPVVEPSVGTFGVNSCANVRQPALICSQTVRLWFSTFQQFEISGKVWKYEDLNQRLERFVWEGKLVGKKTTVG